MYVFLMLFSVFLFCAEVVPLVLSELVKLRAFLKKLPSCSYCCRKHLILGSFVINSVPKLVSLPDRLLCIQIGNIETNANYEIFFFHMYSWDFRTCFIWVFLCPICH